MDVLKINDDDDDDIFIYIYIYIYIIIIIYIYIYAIILHGLKSEELGWLAHEPKVRRVFN